ncbi:MAG: hypothetical protein CMK07_01470 [Ponticaulis sp.]|nr:hypothetical protein [Ponticaulis sp.]
MTRIQFDAIGGDWVDPPMLLPASIPLELSGETIRNRLITSADGPGEELALRPDLTLATVRHFLQSEAEAPVSYRYFGKAFRQPVLEGEPVEFYQTGFEILGDEDWLASDLRTLEAICQEVSDTGIRDCQLYLGDISIFTSVVGALGLSEAWQSRILRAFRRREGISALLKAAPQTSTHSVLSETLSNMPGDQAAALLDEVLALSSGNIVGGRTRGEIIERLQARASASSDPLPDSARDVLSQLIEISGPPSVFLERLSNLAEVHQLDITTILERTRSLISALDEKGVPFWSHAHMSIQFGRRFDYYDGLVFELCHTAFSSQRPLAAGGRYDGLVSMLSQGQRSAPAIGGVIRPDRVRQALEIEAGGAK